MHDLTDLKPIAIDPRFRAGAVARGFFYFEDMGYNQPMCLEETEWFTEVLMDRIAPVEVRMAEVAIADLIPTQAGVIRSKLLGQKERGLDALDPIEVFQVNGMLFVRTHHRFVNRVAEGGTTLTVKLFVF